MVSAKKTGKTHLIPIGKNAAEHLKTLHLRLGEPNKNDCILKGDKNGGKVVSIQFINKRLKWFTKKYDLNIEHFSTHTFRKTFGRYVYEKSGRTNESLLYLNRIFKHSSIDTTMIYLGIRDEEIAGIFNMIEI